MNTQKPVAHILLLLLCLNFPSSFAETYPWKTELKVSLQKQKTREVNDLHGLLEFSAIWQQKCARVAAEGKLCFLRETDVDPKGRPGRLLLFRGESKRFSLPAVSSLVRSQLNGSHYGKSDSLEKVLEQLERDFIPLRELEYAPQATPLYLKTLSSGKPEWRYDDGSAFSSISTAIPVANPTAIPAGALATNSSATNSTPNPSPQKLQSTFLYLLYGFHVEASYLYEIDDEVHQNRGLDPLVSFSTSPDIATSFTREVSPSHGRVMVLSVERKDFVDICSKSKPKLTSGTILSTEKCGDAGNEYSEEAEVDVLFYPREDQIYRSFLLD